MNWIPIVIAIVVVLVILAVALTVWQRHRRARLHEHFGPEYDHVVEETGSTRRAARELEARERRVEELEIRPLTPDEADAFAREWQDVQAKFVDNPQLATAEADDLVARVMRQLMVDRARRRRARKRGGGFAPVTLSQERGTSRTFDADELLALDDAMAQLDPRQRQVVEYRFFGGLDEEEIAQALGVSVRTVRRDWVKARAWLHHALYAQAAP